VEETFRILQEALQSAIARGEVPVGDIYRWRPKGLPETTEK
jgi:hypothetical protein